MSEEKTEASGILAFLKKIGLPGIIAAIVSAVVTMVPFLFQLDERYAKAEDLDNKLVAVSKQINELTIEVGRLAGTQQVIVAIMSAKPEVRLAQEPAPIVQAPAPILLPLPDPLKLEKPTSLEIPKTPEERKVRLDQVSKSLEHTQFRVQQIQQLSK